MPWTLVQARKMSHFTAVGVLKVSIYHGPLRALVPGVVAHAALLIDTSLVKLL